MPKIRDLGINVIPETMRPPEIGAGGGGGGDCQGVTSECQKGTNYDAPGSWTTWMTCGFVSTAHGTFTTCLPGTLFNGRPGGGGTLTTCLPGTVLNCTVGTLTTCLPGTIFDCTPCTVHHKPQDYAQCTPGTLQHCTPGTVQEYDAAGCTPGTRIPTPYLTYMAATQTGQPAAAGLTREAIEMLKNQLHQQIAQLDELSKSFSPSTVEEIDAREQQLKAELEELANCRNRLTSDK